MARNRNRNPLFDLPTDQQGLGFALKLSEGRYVEFSYEKQLETPQSPSAVAARAATVYAAEECDTVKGFLKEGCLFYAKTTGHLCVRLQSSCRRKAWRLMVERDGRWIEADTIASVTNKADARMHFLARCPRLRRLRQETDWKIEGGEYQWRTFRLCGIRPATMKVADGSNGKRPAFACGVGVAEVK